MTDSTYNFLLILAYLIGVITFFVPKAFVNQPKIIQENIEKLLIAVAALILIICSLNLF